MLQSAGYCSACRSLPVAGTIHRCTASWCCLGRWRAARGHRARAHRAFSAARGATSLGVPVPQFPMAAPAPPAADAPAAARSAAPVVLVSQNAFTSTLSYLQGRGLQVLPVPVAESGSAQTYNQLWERCPGVHGILCFPGDVIDAQLLNEAGPNLCAIAVAGERFDHIDIVACNAAGVSLSVTDGELTAAATAEHAVGLCLSLLRNTLAQDFAARTAGVTAQSPGASFGGSLLGSSVGVLGCGVLGTAIAERCAAFRPDNIMFVDPPGEGSAAPPPSNLPLHPGCTVSKATALPELLSRCDVVFLAAPRLSPRSLHCIDAAALAALKPGAVLVNVSAGSLVDEQALAQALQEGRLSGYAADCFACDDVHVPSRPLAIHGGLKTSARTLLTPRVGAAVAATAQRVELEAARALAEALDGRVPRGTVNDVPPRRAGEQARSKGPLAASKAAAGGLVSYLWCF